MKNRPLTRQLRGLTLVELLVAMAIGLIISIAVGTLFLSSTGGARRQSQLGSLQQNVRAAFDYLAHDARMAGHLGCYTGRTAVAGSFNNSITPTDVGNTYDIGVEGYEYRTGTTYTLGSLTPANSTTTGDWESNTLIFAPAAAPPIPITTIAGNATGDGLTPGSDVLIIRTVVGSPVRLSADANGLATTISVENTASTEVCADGSTTKLSGFCAARAGVSVGSHGLIASCLQARVFSVSSIAGTTLTLDTPLNGTAGTPVFPMASSEVFPMQTIAYYVKASSNGRTTSLYRRIFDGDNAGGLEQELIEGVEMLQVRYGVDTDVAPDGVVNQYVDANGVVRWSQVVAIRMGLLIRSSEELDPGVTPAATGIVNGVTVTYPTSTRGYDRRVFTTTVAVRNRISYF